MTRKEMGIDGTTESLWRLIGRTFRGGPRVHGLGRVRRDGGLFRCA